MRLLAPLLGLLLLAGCITPPAPRDAGADGAPVAAPEAEDGAPVVTPEARVDAAALLPLALRWSRAWSDDAELVGVSSALGEDGAPELGRQAQPLDGKDALWGFRFRSPATSGVLVVQLRADGTVHEMFASGDPEPAAPLVELGVGSREARWLALARTTKVVDAFAAKPETEAWAGTQVDAVSYELAVDDSGSAQLTVTSWREERYFAALVDADAWKVLVGGEVPPGLPEML